MEKMIAAYRAAKLAAEAGENPAATKKYFEALGKWGVENGMEGKTAGEIERAFERAMRSPAR